MRYVGFVKDGLRYIGRRDGSAIRPVARADEFYAELPRFSAEAGGDPVDFATAVIAPALPLTSRIFCVGINYRAHALEASAAGIEEPKFPMIFGRWENTLVVDGAPVPVPPNEPGLDWEVELAVIIGKKTWLVSEEAAMDSVFAYATFNDLSARKKQMHTRQFTLGKNADCSGPISPLVTKDEVPNVNNLRVLTRVNGQIMQDANTRDFLHNIPRIISYISDTVTLLPGDVIATGTPGGVGSARNPRIYLNAGDVVEVEVEGVGVVRNPIVSREQYDRGTV
ncbi:MAG: fumarylacetoacetate hydrolase family protein [Hyphomicrobiaceae bacterium]|nr:fumarylacetoacetate hydrolase family protein [Hyphomicrobiaceae bacterium]